MISKRAYMPPRISVEPGRDLPVLDALRDQLGLRLTAQKAPVQYMVIDHVERPSENRAWYVGYYIW